MTIFEHWQQQREPLRQALSLQTDLSGAVYQMRRAISQTEQNALAEMTDEVLRQQAAILFGSVKSSLALIEVNVVHQTWVAQKADIEQPKEKPLLCWMIAVLQLVLVVWLLLRHQWLSLVLVLLSFGLLLYDWFFRKQDTKVKPLPQDKLSVTVKPDTEKILTELDRQMHMMDRSLNDFIYLNEQNDIGKENSGEISAAKASDLMGALMGTSWDDEENEEESREAAEDAAEKLLNQLGLTVLRYTPENRAYFNILPGKQVTKTLTPALLSVQDGHLLKRGTAVVCEKTAG